VVSIGSFCAKGTNPQPIESDGRPAHVAQAAEHLLGKEKVPGSNPGVGSIVATGSARRTWPRVNVIAADAKEDGGMGHETGPTNSGFSQFCKTQ
jgi:hypothetical protein